MTRLLYILTGAVALPAVLLGLAWLTLAYGPEAMLAVILVLLGAAGGNLCFLGRSIR